MSYDLQKWSEEIKKSETLKFYKDVKVAYGQEFYFKPNLPARYLTYWMQIRANCLPISARFIKYSKGRRSNEDKYTCPLCRVRGLFSALLKPVPGALYDKGRDIWK